MPFDSLHSFLPLFHTPFLGNYQSLLCINKLGFVAAAAAVVILISTYEWDHMALAFLSMTYFIYHNAMWDYVFHPFTVACVNISIKIQELNTIFHCHQIACNLNIFLW